MRIMVLADNLTPEIFEITYGTSRLIFDYARAVCREAHRPVEAGGYLFRKIDSTFPVAENACLADHFSNHTGVLLTNKQQIMREYSEKGYEPIGWWHLHPDFNAYMSHIDKPTTEKLLHQFGPATIHESFLDSPEQDQVANTSLDLMLNDYLMLDLSESGDLNSSRLTFYSSWAYALTVNLAGDMYACIARKIYNPLTRSEYAYEIQRNVLILEWEFKNDIAISPEKVRMEAKRKWRAFNQRNGQK